LVLGQDDFALGETAIATVNKAMPQAIYATAFTQAMALVAVVVAVQNPPVTVTQATRETTLVEVRLQNETNVTVEIE
jgi:hypothetical protein